MTKLKVKDYAERFGLTESQVRYRIEKGELQTEKIDGVIHVVYNESFEYTVEANVTQDDVDELEGKLKKHIEKWEGLANADELPDVEPENTTFTPELHAEVTEALTVEVDESRTLNKNLATVQRIDSLEPIDGKDRIELAHIQGWNVIVRKGEFEEGDLCVYIEIDTILPEVPVFQFMEKHKYRVRTVTMGGIKSQGLALPLSIVHEVSTELGNEMPVAEGWHREKEGVVRDVVLEIGYDVTQALSIEKYEKPIPANMKGEAAGTFPSFVPKTDEPRIQSRVKWLNKYKGVKVYVAEKLDGTSATYIYKNGELRACSRNWELQHDSNNVYWKVAEQMNLEAKLKGNGYKQLSRNVVLQGEIVGEGIGKNPYKLRGQHFYLFQIYSIDEQRYLDYEDFVQYARVLDIPTVPIYIVDQPLQYGLQDLLDLVEISCSSLNEEVEIEGIVVRPMIERRDRKHGRVSFKVKLGD